MEVDFHISPRVMCPCGKTVRAMTETERLEYDDALRRLAEKRANESVTLSAKEEARFKDEPTDAPVVRAGLSVARWALRCAMSPSTERTTPD